MGSPRETYGLHKTCGKVWQAGTWKVGEEKAENVNLEENTQSLFPLFLPWVPMSGEAQEAGSLGRTDMVFGKKQR